MADLAQQIEDLAARVSALEAYIGVVNADLEIAAAIQKQISTNQNKLLAYDLAHEKAAEEIRELLLRRNEDEAGEGEEWKQR